MNTSKYKIEITDSSGNRVADLSDRCLVRRYKQKRNRPDLINLSFDLDDLDRHFASIGLTIEQVFATNVNEVHIYKRDSERIAGQINYINISLDETKVDITAVGWLELFDDRVTSILQEYAATDIGEIMWDLIDTSQSLTNGGLGITQGLIQTSRDADRTYEYKNIKEAIIQLSEVQNSPDFEFTPGKVFNVYYPKQGVRKNNVVFTYPGNITAIGYSQDGSDMANEIIASGAGFGPERLITVETDTATQPTYKLRQKLVQFPDVSIMATLEAHAESELASRVRLFNIPKIRVDGDKDPIVGSYGLGDEILIQTTKHETLLAPILGWHRIEEITVDIDQNDHETVDLSLIRA